MNVLIIEDEPYTAERLQRQLKRIDDSIVVLDTLGSLERTLQWFDDHPVPDLIFMDIHLEDENSFELFKEIKIDVPIIYTTAYAEYAIQAFKQNSIDYLLKPIDIEELEKAITKFKNRQNETGSVKTKRRFLVKKGSQLVSIPIKEVAYFKSEQKLNFLITFDHQKFPVDQSLDQLSEVVDPHIFFKISRNRLINVECIHKIHNHLNGRLKLELVPNDDDEVFVSRERVNSFKNWLDR